MTYGKATATLPAVLLLALSLVTGGAQAADAPAKRYPPYPEVWGREMPVPVGRRHSSTFVNDYRNGDFLLVQAHRPFDPKAGNTAKPAAWSRMEFFGGNFGKIPVAEANRLGRLYKPAPSFGPVGSGVLRLSKGRAVKLGTREYGGAKCTVNYGNTIDLINREGKIVATRMVMQLLKEPERRHYWPYCGPGGNPDHYFAKVDALFFFFRTLADGSFLGETPERPFVIRFRPDLTSPFIDQHPDLFLLETAVIDRIVEKAYARQGFRIQDANDALQAYLSKLKSKKEIAR